MSETVQVEEFDHFRSDLMPSFGPEERQAYLVNMNAAYGSVGETGAQNWNVWYSSMEATTVAFQDAFSAAGWSAPEALWDAFWFRIDKPRPDRDAIAHLRLIRALMTDYGPRLQAHIRTRIAREGNVHIGFRGATGMGKSSCMVCLGDWMQRIPPERLVERLCIQSNDIKRALASIQRGEVAFLDELVRRAGEGARTEQLAHENLEDQLRKTGKSLFIASPDIERAGVLQMELEAIFENREAKATLFLVWIKGEPHGVVAISWCRIELYARYEPWKDGNVAGAEAGVFRPRNVYAQRCMKAFEDEGFVHYLTTLTGRPTKVQIEDGLVEWLPCGILSQAEVKHLTRFMFDKLKDWSNKRAIFAKLYGVEPAPAFATVARKFSPEGKAEAPRASH